MKSRFRDSLAPRKRKLILWVFWLVLIYAVIGFLILPLIVRSVAVKQLSEQLNREVSIEKVKINPFALSATIRGLLIKDTDGEPFISWDEVYVNFQLSSFFGHAWVFKEISTSKPYIRVQMNKDKTFNFSDIVAKFSTNAPEPAKAAPAAPVELHVERLHIGGAEAALADFTPREPFKRTLGPLDITLDNFRTDPDSKNPYSFIGTTDAGETISWNGFFYLTPLRSEGELKLFNFALKKYAPLYQDLVRFQVRDGSIAMELKYRVEFSPTNRVLAVNDMAYALRDFKLGTPGDTNNIIDVPLFSITGASADLQHHTAIIDEVELTGARAFLNRNTNAAVNVVELSKPTTTTNAPGGILFLLRSVTNAVAMLLNSTNEWSGTVRNVTATNCELHLTDLANPHPAKLDLSDITLSAKNLSNLPGTNLEADFSLRWNTNGGIHIGANVAFQPTIADIKVDFSHLDLTTLDAYLASKVDLYILGSEVNLHGTVRLRPNVNDLPVVSFNGDASLEHFHTVDGAFGQDLLKWDALRFNHVSANLNPPIIAMREVVLDNAYARLIVETNHTINLANVLKPGNTGTPATNEVKVAATKKTATTNNPVQISIRSIVFTNSTIDFSDLSLKPNVNLPLQSVNGTISDLSSENMQHAIVNLTAKVAGTGPVAITGAINPLNGSLTNDLKISVKDMDLTQASPYSGKFAGYGITEGKLSLDLSYQLVGKKLTAKNVITLDQFTFGDKVNSPDATHLPVRLAVAILKDRDGKIVLDVPIDGSVDDPDIRTGKVIKRALLNILEKVATSPFSLLGAAFGGSEALGWLDFAAGSAVLTDADKKKLDSLAKALYARPALKLAIAGSIDSEGDPQGLERVTLDQQIRTRMWKKLRRTDQAKTSAEQIVLTPSDRTHYIQKMLAEAYKTGVITPELIAANTNLAAYAAEAKKHRPSSKQKTGSQLLMTHDSTSQSESAGPVSKLVPPPDPSEALLLATIIVNNNDLAALAAARAQAVQTYLLDVGKVDASRIFLTASGPENLRQGGSRAYLEFR